MLSKQYETEPLQTSPLNHVQQQKLKTMYVLNVDFRGYAPLGSTQKDQKKCFN